MKYLIEEFDGLFLVYRWERIGWRIIIATETKAEAEEYVRRN